MTADHDDAPPALRTALRWGQWTAVLAGPLSYGVGRIMTDTFYGRFGASPDEVGLSYLSLVVPAAAVTLSAAGAVVAIVLAGPIARAAGWLVPGYAVLWFVFSSERSWRDVGTLALVIAGFALLVAVGWMREGRSRHVVVVVSAAAIVVLVTTGAWYVADRAATRAARGEPTDLGVGPLDIGHGAPLVRVSGLEPSGLDPGVGCALLLGSADGVTVLLADGAAWRVPSDVITTTAGVCEPPDALLAPTDLPAGWTIVDSASHTLDSRTGLWACGIEPPDRSFRWDGITLRRELAAGGSLFAFHNVRLGEPAEAAARVQTARRVLEDCPDGWEQPFGEAGDNVVAHVSNLIEVSVPGLDVDHVVWRSDLRIDSEAGAGSTITWITAAFGFDDLAVHVSVQLGPDGDEADALAIVRAAAERLTGMVVDE